jgi:hypothetical protein
MKPIASTFVLFLVASSTSAQVVVDGSRDVDYGAALAVQTVQTQFGDASPPGSTAGGELDAAYATILGDRLYLLITGNQEPNFNKLEIFFDSRAGGENTLTNVPQYDVFNTSQNFGGFTFDAGFTADFHLISFWGGDAAPYEALFVDRQGGVAAMVPGSDGATAPAVGLQAAGVILAGDVGANASGTALTQNLEFAINNNNSAGVSAGTAAADTTAAAAVTTGMEFSIALADLGSPAPGSTIRIFAAYGSGDHNYMSNQLLAGLPAPQGNLGGDGAGGFTGTLSGIDLGDFAGDQFFSIVVPEEPIVSGVAVPTLTPWMTILLSGLLAGLALLVLARRSG